MNSIRKTSIAVALAAAVVSIFAVSVTIAAPPDPAKGPPDPPKGKKETHFRAKLDATQEVPLISSLGTGDFEATLNAAQTQLTFTLSYEDLEGGAATAAHVHLGQPGVAGGVMFFLCGGGGKPMCPAGNATVTGTVVAADVVGPGNQGIAAGEFAEVIRNMREKDSTYANVHTTSYPNGEIRGVVKD